MISILKQPRSVALLISVLISPAFGRICHVDCPGGFSDCSSHGDYCDRNADCVADQWCPGLGWPGDCLRALCGPCVEDCPSDFTDCGDYCDRDGDCIGDQYCWAGSGDCLRNKTCPDDDDEVGAGAIIGIIAGVLAFIVGIVVAVYCWKKSSAAPPAQAPVIVQIQGDGTAQQAQPGMAQPMVQQMAQPMAQQMAQPMAQQMAQPMAQQMAQPMAQPMAQQMAQPMAQQMAAPMQQQAPMQLPVADVVGSSTGSFAAEDPERELRMREMEMKLKEKELEARMKEMELNMREKEMQMQSPTGGAANTNNMPF